MQIRPRAAASARIALLAAIAAGALAACGGDDEPQEPGAGGSDAGADSPVHVHGLGVNPKDGALFIATHTGLFRVARGEEKARRVGDSTQDTMGFTVLGGDRFLGSGHPGEGESAVNPLGLIRSSDAGRSWSPVSLEGEADFHVLRSAHGRVYGFDSMNGRFLISGDAGRSWSEREVPGPVIDLAIDPRDRDTLVAAAEDGLHVSKDEGRSWRRLGGAPGLLAWPKRDRLYVVDGGGSVHLSGDGGRRWAARGSIGGQPAALLGRAANEVYAALHDGTVKRSSDAGASWAVHSAP